jgi:hypothetical protein
MQRSAERLTLRTDVTRREPSYVRIFEHTHASDSRGDTVRRITKAALGGLAGCALILGTTQAANGTVVEFNTSGPLVEIPLPLTWTPLPSDDAFDAASATLRIKDATEASNFKLTVTGIAPTAGPVHGAHLHKGPCPDPDLPLAERKDTTSGHYKDDSSILGAVAENEVWFDLVPNDHGTATDSTTAPFVPVDNETPGVMSIVIHARSAALPTAESAKLVCFPLEVTEAPKWIPIPDLI